MQTGTAGTLSIARSGFVAGFLKGLCEFDVVTKPRNPQTYMSFKSMYEGKR